MAGGTRDRMRALKSPTGGANHYCQGQRIHHRARRPVPALRPTQARLVHRSHRHARSHHGQIRQLALFVRGAARGQIHGTCCTPAHASHTTASPSNARSRRSSTHLAQMVQTAPTQLSDLNSVELTHLACGQGTVWKHDARRRKPARQATVVSSTIAAWSRMRFACAHRPARPRPAWSPNGPQRTKRSGSVQPRPQGSIGQPLVGPVSTSNPGHTLSVSTTAGDRTILVHPPTHTRRHGTRTTRRIRHGPWSPLAPHPRRDRGGLKRLLEPPTPRRARYDRPWSGACAEAGVRARKPGWFTPTGPAEPRSHQPQGSTEADLVFQRRSVRP
jgi:hypothetical protein